MAESEEKKTVEIPEKFQKLVEQIDKLSVLELSELVKVLEDHYGVSAAAPAAAAAALLSCAALLAAHPLLLRPPVVTPLLPRRSRALT